MNKIKEKTEIAERNRSIRGTNETENSPSYLIEIPQNTEFEGYCLILSIILGAILEKGIILKETKYEEKAKKLWHIKNKDKSKKKLACSALKNQFDTVMKNHPRLKALNTHTLENTCPILARFYKVNIVIHELEFGDDKIFKIFNPWVNKSDKYYADFPRIDILITKNDLLDYDHACLISPKNYYYKRKYGWTCTFCKVRVKKIGHFTYVRRGNLKGKEGAAVTLFLYKSCAKQKKNLIFFYSYSKTCVKNGWQRHKCKANRIHSCTDCTRIQMKENIEYKQYDRTVDMFCDSSIFKDEKLELCCVDCMCIFQTESCLKHHKRNRKCNLQERCIKCNKIITFNTKAKKEQVIRKHDCNKKMIFCQICYHFHDEHQESCKLNIWQNTLWEINPKICVLSAAISDKNNYVECVLCRDKKDFVCHFHENLPKESSVNFVSTLREIDLHGTFHEQFFDNFGVESDEKIKCTKKYQPVFNEPTTTWPKKTNFASNKKKKHHQHQTVINFEPSSSLEYAVKKILLTESFENSIVVVEEKIMPFVFASLEKLVKIEDNVRGQKNTFIRLKLPWTNCEFCSLSAYLQNYKSFADQKQELFFPMLLNFKEFYKLDKLPCFEIFKKLSDSKEIIKEKEMFYEKQKEKTSWNFEEQMQVYLSEKAEQMLTAVTKLLNLTCLIQDKLRENYGWMYRKPLGCIFRSNTVSSFFYTLMVHYSQSKLEKPIFSLKFEEYGVPYDNMSELEFFFQHYMKFLRQDSMLIASHLSPNGGKKFSKMSCDVYDSTESQIILLHGCYWHG